MKDLENPIVGVAFKHKYNRTIISLLKPHRHNHLFEWLHENMKGRFKHSHWKQGFITLSGQFLTRAEAAEHAVAINQTTPEYSGELFSEDLW